MISSVNGALTQYANPHASEVQVVDRVHQMAQIPAQAVEFPEDEHILFTQGLETSVQAWTLG